MDNDNQLRVGGYACFFHHLDQNNDIILETAFDKFLQQPLLFSKVKFLYQHDITRPIGRWTHIQADNLGLYVEGILDQNLADGMNASIMTRHKIINGLSIGYKANHSIYNQDNHRILQEITLFEISLVTFPMQANTHLCDISQPLHF